MKAGLVPKITIFMFIFAILLQSCNLKNRISEPTTTPYTPLKVVSLTPSITIAPTPTRLPPTPTRFLPTSTPEPATIMEIVGLSEKEFNNINSFIVIHAMIKLGLLENKFPGLFQTDLTLKGSRSYGLFAWCSRTEERLFEILSKLSYSLIVNGKEINTNSFSWVYHRDSNQDYCAVPGILLTPMENGVYHIIVTQTIQEEFRDSIGPFRVGDYVYDMMVTFE
ncbi:MAG: hypothetical protein AB9891_00520 [Anaerolineaceae bacterium]